MNLISGIQQWHTNQHSLSSWTSFHHLKLRPCSRQMAQHISWSQGCSTSLLISESISQTSTPVWTVPDIILVITNGLLIYWSTKNQNVMRQTLFYLANYYRSSVKKKNAILLSRSDKCTFKHLIVEKNIFLVLIIMIINLFILPTLKIVFDWNTSVYQTCYIHTLQELLQITLLLVNIG